MTRENQKRGIKKGQHKGEAKAQEGSGRGGMSVTRTKCMADNTDTWGKLGLHQRVHINSVD